MAQMLIPWGPLARPLPAPEPDGIAEHRCVAEPTPLPPLWPHQGRAIDLVADSYRRGHRAVLVTVPTGGGKTRTMAEMCGRAVAKGRRAGVLTNRRLLTGQAGETLDRQGIAHGFVAAGFAAEALHDVQVLSVQTIGSRVGKGGFALPDLDILHVDEAHSNAAETAQGVIAHYRDQGALVVGWTATPLGLSGLYTDLVIAGTPSELRACGALVHCQVFAPDEPDMKGVQRRPDGEFVERQATKRAMETICFGNVFDAWERLNPWRLPTLLWAPGVEESRWFAKEFRARGVRAEHIEGGTPDALRREYFAASRSGDLPVLCSCGVLREGVDLPWVVHGVLVQPCAALTTFLQVVGRLLRAHPGKTGAVLQDHAGAWWRHGSPNADRAWSLADDDRTLQRRLKDPKPPAPGGEEDPEPDGLCCPRCGAARWGGAACPNCGHEHRKSVRHVRMAGGKLVRMVGDAVKRKKAVSAEQRTWTSCLYAAASCGQTLKQAAHSYYRQTGRWVPSHLQHVPPSDSRDWDRYVSDLFPWFKRRSKQ